MLIFLFWGGEGGARRAENDQNIFILEEKKGAGVQLPVQQQLQKQMEKIDEMEEEKTIEVALSATTVSSSSGGG